MGASKRAQIAGINSDCEKKARRSKIALVQLDATGLALKRGKPVDFTGYWQRYIVSAPSP